MRSTIAIALLVLVGCTGDKQPVRDIPGGEPTKPFRGLADDEERKIEDG